MKFFKRTFIWLFCIALGLVSLSVLFAPYALLDGLLSRSLNGYQLIGSDLWWESFWGPMAAVLQILVIVTGAGLLAVGLAGLIREFVASPVPEIKKGGVMLALSYTLLNLVLMIMLIVLWATTRGRFSFRYRFTYGVIIALVAGFVISMLLLILIKVLGDTSVWKKTPRAKNARRAPEPAAVFVQPAQNSYGQMPQPISYALPPSVSYGQVPQQAVYPAALPPSAGYQQPVMSYGQMPPQPVVSYGTVPATAYLPSRQAPSYSQPQNAVSKPGQTDKNPPPKTSAQSSQCPPPDSGVDFRFVEGMSEKQVRAAVDDLYVKATRGEADAQFRLGICYQNGTGVQKNLVTAAEWQQKASAQGHPQAEFVLGQYHIDGTGVPVKIVEGITLIKKSAQKGFVGAQMRLGSYYQKGEYLPRDYDKAVSWYTKAAEQGNEYAVNALKCFEKGANGKWRER